MADVSDAPIVYAISLLEPDTHVADITLDITSSTVARCNRRGIQALLRLASHELFHAFNVKRLRPHELSVVNFELDYAAALAWFDLCFAIADGEGQPAAWQLQIDAAASREHVARRRAWAFDGE